MRRAGSLLPSGPFPQHYRARAAFRSWSSPQTQPGSLAPCGCREAPLHGIWGRLLQDCLPDREPQAQEKEQGQVSVVHGIHMDCFSPLSLPQAKTLSFPMLKQAQLVAPRGPAPETPAGGKELIRTGRAELCRFLFPPFSLLMAEVREGHCVYELLHLFTGKSPSKLTPGLSCQRGKQEGKHRATQGDRAPECPQGGESQRRATLPAAPAPGCSSPGDTRAARCAAW